MDRYDFDEEFDASVDLTPLLDVVFLLIIFFVLATTFSRPVLDLLLPVTDSAEKSKEGKADLIVEIDEAGKVLCEKKYYGKDEIDKLVKYKPGVRMNLFVHKDAPFDSFITIIDKAKLVNRNNIVVTTRKDEK